MSSLKRVKKSAQRTPIPREIKILVVAAFIIALGFGLVSPILPQFAKSFDVAVWAASAVVSVFAATRLLFAPMSGRLVDVFGSRVVYLSGLITVALGTGAIALAQEYWQLIALRAASGIGSTMFTVSAMSLIVRIAPPNIRGRASSVYATAFLFGAVIGPVLGALLSGLGMRIPFVIYAVMLVVATIVVAVQLNPETKKAIEENGHQPSMSRTEAIHNPTYVAALIGAFAFGWINFGVRVAVLPLFASHVFSWGEAVAGFALTTYAIGNAITLQFSGNLADSWGRRPCVLIGMVVSTLFTAVIGMSEQAWILLAVSLLAGVGAAFVNPAQQAVIADIVGNERSGGKVLALYQMAQDFGAISGPLAVGALVDIYGYQTAFLSCGLIGLLAFGAWMLFGKETLAAAEA